MVLMITKIKFYVTVSCFIFLVLSCSNIPSYNNETEGKDTPAVSFTNILNTQIINSPIIINGRASDNKGVSSVKIVLDGSEYDATPSPDWNTWNFDLAGIAVTTGEHNITAIARNIDGVESSASVIFYYNDGIDLEAVKVDVTGTSVNRQSLFLTGTVKVDVRNNSIYTVSNNYRVALFEDSNFNLLYDSGTDRILGYADVSAGHTSLTTRTVDVDVNLPVLFADNLIYAFVDSNDSVMETSEVNNSCNNMTGVQFIPPVGSFNPVIEWQWTGSAINPTSNQVICLPVVSPLIDTNGDGQINSGDIPYIIFNSYIESNYQQNGTLRAIKGDGSAELFSVTEYKTNPISNPAIADIDNDGRPDIVVVEEFHHIMAFNNDGTLKWTSSFALPIPTPNSFWRSVTIADLDEDGTPEIIVGDYVFNNDGTLRWSGGNTNTMGSMTSCIAKLMPDNHPSIITGNTAYNFDGSIYWRNSSVLNGFTAVGDVNRDGFPDIVVVSSARAWLLNSDGTIIWGPIVLPSAGGGAPTIADVNGDGEIEIGIACAMNFIVLNSNGNIIWSKTTKDASSNMTGSSVFDFEGDGKSELVYADEDFLRIYNGSDGEELFKTAVGSGTGLELPVIVDVDNDNKSEIIVVSNDLVHTSANPGVIVFGDANHTWVNTRKIWNQHSYHITNVNDDATIPQYETNNWSIYNNYRQNQLMNPFEAFDLSSSFLRVEQSGFPGSVTITARIGNSGALAIGSSFFVAFYDGNPESGGTLIGTKEIIIRMEPGTYVDVDLVWNIPSGGFHNIYVVADDDGAGHTRLREINESNNSISSVFSF